ncbi:kynureninase [Metschnikowia bicuspidata var. bicuspidata NRRL YB-4993]|uniref:Kynureninase n=1 Tax=Metschnikowia bicuspidata var. bicuspidata NRRL YB-4993 TaxID=869754 RepID=A0A1A0H9Q6_9ASCO|nr:kynureninase [Metschnikowia bicuspidata var. bicuspidata NRRL YB-4993]OBA20725.1 kynureninase [Metschnikowia bicuspidata var. bicuspidata NRRL YB-4993]
MAQTNHHPDTSKDAALDTQFGCHRHEFVVPTFLSLGVSSPAFGAADPAIYFCGNSLGLMPKSTRPAIEAELQAWGERAVEAHFNHPDGNKTMWMDIDLPLVDLLAPIVGAKPTEVAAMGSLTANLNALLVSFYKPGGRRTKILMEKNAFPSDYYALLNMVKMHGHDESHLIQLDVPAGETYLQTQRVLDAIEQHQDELALVLLPGIQYYTGQFFDIGTITQYAQQRGVPVGWDLAHAVGNVVLRLHEWNVDFAAWCSYKYLNSGPGAIGGIYVHERYTQNNCSDSFAPRLAGWWGNDAAQRFQMLEHFDPIQSALSYRQLNPSVIDCVALQSSLEIFKKAGGMGELRKKSEALTGHLEALLVRSRYCLSAGAPGAAFGFRILTPASPAERGCQLSLLFQPHADDPAQNVMEQVHRYLHEHAIICDERRPDVLRLAPVPLYNTFREVSIVVARLEEALGQIEKRRA